MDEVPVALCRNEEGIGLRPCQGSEVASGVRRQATEREH